VFEKGDIMETIRNVDVNRLHDFKNHPFKVEMNTELCELMRSIEKEGVLVPLLVRTNPYGDGYEVISGHRRKEAAIWAGETKVPVVIRELDDDAITPGAVEYKYKLMFEDRSISVLSYNLETLLAEKMQTILARGLANTRMRDFYDVYEIMNSKADQISFDVLKKAFAATCMKRETSFGEEEVRETLDKIKDDSGLEEMWNRFKRVNYFVDDLSWGEVSETIVDNIEKIFFLATRFLESVMKRE